MSKLYRPAHRDLQARFDTARLADRIEATLYREQFTAEDRAFIERLDMFFLATADADGRPSCSFKGGDPGFVRVSGAAELVFPCYDGNGMFLSMGNATENPNVGLLFIDFESPKRLRVNGTAQLASADHGRVAACRRRRRCVLPARGHRPAWRHGWSTSESG
jgi:predicted pyridoxine 5'-phosphate oxidase superfamily flavin-nucleotide-binding protein